MTPRHRHARPPLVLLLAALAGLTAGPPALARPVAMTDPAGETVAPLPAEAIGANNRGVGLMGRFEYGPAWEVFAGLVQAHPEWLQGRVNLAIATLNRQLDGDEKAALALVDEVLTRDPAHLRAHYVAGLLRLYLASPAEALPHFHKVAEADPNDAYAAYYMGQTLAQLGRPAEALPAFRLAMRLDPYLRSAYYGAFQALQRLGEREEARRLAEEYQRLAANPRARLAEFKYTRMGPKAEALAVDAPPKPPTAPLPLGPVFAPTQPLAAAGLPGLAFRPDQPAGVTATDLNGDGRLDLFVAGAVAGEPARNLVLMAAPDGGFTADLAHPLAAITDVRAAAWGDVDNDGRVDVYLARRGPNQLWRQDSPGEWRDVTAESGTDGGARDSADAALLDADHDGDLDVFVVNADGANELFSNNGNGTFRPIAAAQGIAGPGRGARTVVAVDLDRDRDVDLIVLNREPPHEAYLNDRLWSYRPAPGFEAFSATPALTALAADMDADGFAEIYAVDPAGPVRRWLRAGDGTWRGEVLTRLDDEAPWAQLAVLDADGDGRLELLLARPEGWRLIGASGKVLAETLVPEESPLAGALVWPAEPARGPSVLALGGPVPLTVASPGTGRYPFLALTLSGATDPANAMRSNASGIGARLAVRVDSRWTVIQGHRSHSGPGQGLTPVTVGLGPEGRADFVAIEWSEGVFQSEIDLGPGSVHRIVETQRQLSSCPVLFGWDGKGYAFVTDFLGVGGLGYAVGPGEYAEPRPWENLLLPPGLLQPREGRYALKLTEPMEETGYLDQIRLVAYDLPPGWDLVLDERMGTGGPVPTGQPRYYRRELLPSEARNGRGEDVTATVRAADGAAAPLGPRDRRFVGRLETEEVLTLRFDRPLNGGPGAPVLVADGWVEYPYSQTSFAAWQAGATFDPPTLEARGADGAWVTVARQFGYPAGMPRRMSLPLNGLPAGTTQLRLRGNLEVYWDRLAVAFAEEPPAVRQHALPLVATRLATTGFPLRTDGPQHRPDYDYARRSPFWDARYLEGLYTRPGPVDELLAEHDDALVVLGSGEEVHAEFAAPAEAPPSDWTRRLVLETRGWTKDMDLYTRDGETVGPLPSSGQAGDGRERLHAVYNIRYLGGY